jgi:hypothetical protein
MAGFVCKVEDCIGCKFKNKDENQIWCELHASGQCAFGCPGFVYRYENSSAETVVRAIYGPDEANRLIDKSHALIQDFYEKIAKNEGSEEAMIALSEYFELGCHIKKMFFEHMMLPNFMEHFDIDKMLADASADTIFYYYRVITNQFRVLTYVKEMIIKLFLATRFDVVDKLVEIGFLRRDDQICKVALVNYFMENPDILSDPILDRLLAYFHPNSILETIIMYSFTEIEKYLISIAPLPKEDGLKAYDRFNAHFLLRWDTSKVHQNDILDCIFSKKHIDTLARVMTNLEMTIEARTEIIRRVVDGNMSFTDMKHYAPELAEFTYAKIIEIVSA